MRLGRAADHSPPSSAAVMEEYSYTSTHPLGHTGPVTGSLYLFIKFNKECIICCMNFIDMKMHGATVINGEWNVYRTKGQHERV